MMIWNLFKSPQLRLMESKLQELELALALPGDIFSAGKGLSIIKPSLVSAMRSSSSKIKNKISKEGISPNVLLYVAILHLVERDLLSGHHHIYRGTLSMSGTSLMALGNFCLTEMVRLGATSETEAGTTREWFSKELSEIG